MSLEPRLLPSGHFIHPHPSINFNDRPNDVNIGLIVLHYTDFLTVEESLNCLTDPTSHVSCHYLVHEDGTIYQLVADHKRAWHAGVSEWMGQTNINNNSIGIELQNGGMTYKKTFGNWPPYPEVQMIALAALILDVQKRYKIPNTHIVGHSDIAPTRKIDPGEHFDWPMLFRLLSNE